MSPSRTEERAQSPKWAGGDVGRCGAPSASSSELFVDPSCPPLLGLRQMCILPELGYSLGDGMAWRNCVSKFVPLVNVADICGNTAAFLSGMATDVHIRFATAMSVRP